MGDPYGDRGTAHDSGNRSIANAGLSIWRRVGPEPPPRDEAASAARLRELGQNYIDREARRKEKERDHEHSSY